MPGARGEPAGAAHLQRPGVTQRGSQTAVGCAYGQDDEQLGFCFALLIGTPLGLVVARVRFVGAAIGPILSGLQSLPSVAWVPPAVIWLGLKHRGDMRDARYWAEQIMALESEPWQYAPVAHQVVDTTVPGPAGMAVYLDLPDIAAAVPEEAVKDAVDDLTVATLDGFGAIPQPSPDLAHQLQDLVAH